MRPIRHLTTRMTNFDRAANDTMTGFRVQKDKYNWHRLAGAIVGTVLAILIIALAVVGLWTALEMLG